ncbi:MAG: hypothetical protein QOG99_1857 [Frankiales bacterium]|nr:hypothetical protein [Frankiales bacterium]
MWDGVLSPGANPNLPTFLLGIATGLESIFALTQSGIARTARRQRLNRRFEDRGIRDTDDDWSPLSRPRRSTVPHRSAVVSAFSPGYLGIHDDLHDLFLAEYLAARLPAGTTLSKHTQSLADRISRFRDDAATRDTNSGGGEPDDGRDSGGKEPEAGRGPR